MDIINDTLLSQLKESEEFKRLQRSLNCTFTDEFSKVLIQAIKSGDFQQHLTVPDHCKFDGKELEINQRIGVTYVPYRNSCTQKMRIQELEQIIQDAAEIMVNISLIDYTSVTWREMNRWLTKNKPESLTNFADY